MLLTVSLLLVRFRTVMVIKIGRIRRCNALRRPWAVRRLIKCVEVNPAALMRRALTLSWNHVAAHVFRRLTVLRPR